MTSLPMGGFPIQESSSWDSSTTVPPISTCWPRLGRERRAGKDRQTERHLGGQEVLSTIPAGTYYAVGIGDGTARRRMCHQAEAAGLRPLTLIHSTATHGRCASFGEGAIICAGVRITTNVTVGKQVHINLNCSIGHDAVLGDFTTINPLSAISGWVHLGEEVLIGAHSQVNQNLSVGDGATVGAGAVAVKDVAAGTTVVGIPAKPLTRG